MTIKTATGFPTGGRKRAPMLPEAVKLLEEVNKGSVCVVSGSDADKVIRQVRQAVAEAGGKLRTKAAGADPADGFYVGLKK